MSAKWLNRQIITVPLYYTVCASQKAFEKELKKLRVDKRPGVNEGKGATAHFFTAPGENTAVIVCLFKTRGLERLQVWSLLLHEAVHIWQEMREIMGEESPSKEFEAYSIQAIAQNLMYEFKRQKGW